MAFNAGNLAFSGRLGASNQYIWTYTTTDDIEDVLGYEYFVEAYETFRTTDMVKVTANDGDVLVMVFVDFAPPHVSADVK